MLIKILSYLKKYIKKVKINILKNGRCGHSVQCIKESKR